MKMSCACAIFGKQRLISSCSHNLSVRSPGDDLWLEYEIHSRGEGVEDSHCFMDIGRDVLLR